MSSRLRVALVWQGEMMADHVAGAASPPITLGTAASSTFVVPLLAVPDGHAVLRRDGDAWSLALTAGLGGSVHTGGELRDVAALTAAAGAVHVPLGARDWGVLELGGGAGLQLFFQFVEEEAPLPRSRSRWDLLTPALAFALLLHAVLLFATYVFEDERRPLVYGERELTGDFLVQRIVVPPEPPPGQPAQPGMPSGGEGAPGAGQPEAGEVVDPRPPRAAPPSKVPPPDVGLLRRPNRAILRSVIDQDFTPALGRFLGLPGPRRPGYGPGYGPGPGVRPGPGSGPGAGPGQGPRNGPGPGPALDVGPIRDRSRTATGEPREVEVELLPPTTDGGGLTRDDIGRIVRSRLGLIRACYQRALDRRRDLGGTLTIRFVIAPEGHVSLSRVVADATSLDDAQVQACVLRQIDRLHFPARGGGTVTFPFRFALP